MADPTRAKKHWAPACEPEAVPARWHLLAAVFFLSVSGLALKDAEETRAEGRRDAFLQRVNLNTATRDELEALWGIGPVFAGEVEKIRPLEHIDDLTKISGIGPMVLTELRPVIRVSENPAELRQH